MARCETTPALVLALYTQGRDPREVKAGLASAPHDAEVVGCRVPGIMYEGRVLRDGVAVLALGGSLTARVGWANGAENDSRECGRRAAAAAVDRLEREVGRLDWSRSAMLVFADPFGGNAVDIVRGVDDETGGDLRLAGGGAADDPAYPQHMMFAGEQMGAGAAMCIALSSDGPLGCDLRHGCVPFGPPIQVTRSSGRRLIELAFEPAAHRYRRFASDKGVDLTSPERFAEFAMMHPLGLPQDSGGFVLRCLLGAEGDGSLQCCSVMPEHGVLRMMQGERGGMLEAAERVGRESRALAGGNPALGLLFACFTRDITLGTTPDGCSEDLLAASVGLGDDVATFGALTVGQIGSLENGAPQFHAKSLQSLTFS
ncbi:MAG: FIST N-terminal domain-containing protein [Planctomycetota bacterium]